MLKVKDTLRATVHMGYDGRVFKAYHGADACGGRVQHLDEKRAQELFAELEKYGVRHDDADPRNVTYRFSDGRFCLIDFEFATILPESKPT